MKKKIVTLAAGMLLFLMSGIFLLQPHAAKAENDMENLGGYMTAAQSGRSVIFNLIDSDNKIAESYNIRAVAAESGVPGSDPHMPVSFNVSSTARTNSSHFNFSVVPGTYRTKLDQHGMYTILDLTCTMRVPPYLRQAGVGDDSIPEIFKSDRIDGYQTYIDNYPYGRFGTYDYDPRGCVGFAPFQLPKTPDGAERGSYTFKLQINIGNFRMNEKTSGNIVAKKTYQFRYNKVAFLFNVANASVGSGHGFSSQNGYLNFDLLGGGQLLVVPFNGNPATFETAAGYDVYKPGYRFHCWESTVNNAAYGGGQSFNANTTYILELFRDHANPAGCSVVNVDDSNPGQAWTGINQNLTILQELKPVWDLIGYKITYNLQGGTNPNNPDSYTVETPDFTLKNPTRAGYEFTGWTGSNGTTKEKNVTIRKGTTGDLTFTANWNRLLAFYNLTFDLKGGSISKEAPEEVEKAPLVNEVQEEKLWNSNSNIAIYTKTTNKKYFVKKGYEFMGWYFEDGTKFTGNEKATADTTVYAHWKLVEYPITYHLKGGTDPENPDKYTIGTPDFTLKNPEKAGYEFTGWTGSNGETPETEVIVKQGSTGAKEYTANWRAVEYPITYHLKGGTDPKNPDKYTVETPDILLKNPEKGGYAFLGWTGSNGSTPDTGVMIAKGSTGAKEYTANWTAVDYKIDYDLKGGTDPHNPSGYNTETPDFTLKNPTKKGYEFKGWTGSNGSTPEAEVTVKQGSTGDKKFTANWKPAAYKITYDLDGGSNPKNPTRYTVETPNFTLKNPKKKGYIFKGWTGTELKDRTKKVTVKKGSTGDRHYKANWEPKMSKLPYLKTSKLINKGSSFRFLVYGEKKKGYRRIWKNSNKKVISLSKKGVAKAKKNGTAVVGYKLYDKKDRLVYGFQIKVRVITTDFQTLNTSKKISVQNPTFMFDKTLCIGKKFKLGFRNLEKDAKVTYQSSNSKILSVSKKGVATSKKKGFAYVTITLKQQHLTYRYRVHFKCEKIEF